MILNKNKNKNDEREFSHGLFLYNQLFLAEYNNKMKMGKVWDLFFVLDPKRDFN